MTELLTTVIQVAGLTRRKTWFNPPFSWEMHVPSWEYDSCFLVSYFVVPFKIQTRPPFKLAAVTKNKNVFSCQFLLYYKSK
jgi:hypothetical protein